ncbi:hypothetical protein Tco_1262750 [Tanacetum coccineum]
MTRIVALCLGFRKWVLEDPSYVTGGEPEYPQELFSVVDFGFYRFGQMTTLLPVPTLDSATSMCYAGCILYTKDRFPWYLFGRLSPNNFCLLFCGDGIIVTVVIVMVILIVVVVVIVGVVIVVAIFGAVFPLFATGISLGPVFLLGLSAFAMVAACASRAAVIPSVMSCWMAAKVMAGVSDVDVLLGGILST